jgi:hypothetical protein
MDITIVYLHGFASAGAGSAKAEALKEIFHDQLVLAPNLPDRPSETVPFLADYLGKLEGPVMLVGSSMGGWYASCFGGRFQWPVALINPLVELAEPELFLGEHENYYTGNRFTLDEADLAALAVLQPLPGASPTLVLLDMNDEVLDAEKAIAAYKGRGIVVAWPGGNHRFAHMHEAAPLLRQQAGLG